MATGAAGLLIISYLRNKQNGASSSSPTNTTDSSQIPQFINQTYSTVNPPAQDITQTNTVNQNPVQNPSTPKKLSGITAEATLGKGETKRTIAAKWGVPLGSVFQVGNHVWTYAHTGNAKEGVTAQGKLTKGETVQQWANEVGVPAAAVQQSGSNVWTYAMRANTKSDTLNVQTPSVVAGT